MAAPTVLNNEASRALDTQRGALAHRVVARHYEIDPDSWQPYGSAGRQRCVQDVEYHLMYLSEAIAVASPAIFLDYVAWLKVLFAGLGFSDRALQVALDCLRHIIIESLPPATAALVDGYLELALAQANQAPDTLPSCIRADNPLAALARQYLETLLGGDRHRATQLIVGAAQAGVNVRDIYLHVFQPCQHEIGRLWQMNRISVAQEHFFTAATQLAASQLYPYIFSTPRGGRRLLATCVSGELHEIGARIVADLFEIEGWDTTYLGANTPTEAVLDMLEERKPDVLAISATMTFHVRAVADLIARVRAAQPGSSVAIMVGGYPFNVAPDLWERVGADGSARDGLDAIAVAQRLVGEASSVGEVSPTDEGMLR